MMDKKISRRAYAIRGVARSRLGRTEEALADALRRLDTKGAEGGVVAGPVGVSISLCPYTPIAPVRAWSAAAASR